MTVQQLQALIDLSLAHAAESEWGEFWFPYYHLLYLLALGSNPEGICVELGVDKGRGCLSMAKSGARVFGVEQNEKECFNSVHPSNVSYLKCSSTPVPEVIAAYGRAIAVLHIDTEHSFARARDEFEAYKGFLKDGAVVCFDDTNAMERDVLRYVQSLPYEKIVDDRLHPSCGYAALIYREGV